MTVPMRMDYHGLNSEDLAESGMGVFVSLEWIDDDEFELVSSYFAGGSVSVVRFGEGPWPTSIEVEGVTFDDASEAVSKGVYGDFIIWDERGRALIIFDARNMYVFVGPEDEAKKLASVVPADAGVEEAYSNGRGDFSIAFPKTREAYEYYRPFHLKTVGSLLL